MIYNYNDFLLEFSDNDAFPELGKLKKKKTGIFLIGAPGSGKSYFRDVILIPRLKNVKIFDPDSLQKQISKILTKNTQKLSTHNISKFKKLELSKQEKQEKIDNIKDSLAHFLSMSTNNMSEEEMINNINIEDTFDINVFLSDEEIEKMVDDNEYYFGSNELMLRMFETYIKHSNADFIFDTTGKNHKKIGEYTSLAKEYNYDVIYIKLTASIDTLIGSNLKRNRKAEVNYQMKTIDSLTKNEKEYLKYNPTSYYVYNRDKNLLYKYINNKLKLVKKEVFRNGK